MNAQQNEQFLATLKMLADESRLTLVRLLNEREYNVGELAANVQLAEPTVSHHLSRLHSVGLLSLRMAGNQRFYRLNHAALAKFKAMMTSIEQMPTSDPSIPSDNRWIEALGFDEADQKVLREHTLNGKLIQIPMKQKKLLVVLRWLATLFEAGRLYTEKEVNTVIKSVNAEDIAGLRRDLVDFGYLRRERNGGKYWLAPADDAPSA